jgi:hypothetical protein
MASNCNSRSADFTSAVGGSFRSELIAMSENLHLTLVTFARACALAGSGRNAQMTGIARIEKIFIFDMRLLWPVENITLAKA